MFNEARGADTLDIYFYFFDFCVFGQFNPFEAGRISETQVNAPVSCRRLLVVLEKNLLFISSLTLLSRLNDNTQEFDQLCLPFQRVVAQKKPFSRQRLSQRWGGRGQAQGPPG